MAMRATTPPTTPPTIGPIGVDFFELPAEPPLPDSGDPSEVPEEVGFEVTLAFVDVGVTVAVDSGAPTREVSRKSFRFSQSAGTHPG